MAAEEIQVLSRPTSPVVGAARGGIINSLLIEPHHEVSDVLQSVLNSIRILSNPDTSRDQKKTVYDTINRISSNTINETLKNTNFQNLQNLVTSSANSHDVRAPITGTNNEITSEVLKSFQNLFPGPLISTQTSEFETVPIRTKDLLNAVTIVTEKYGLSAPAAIKLIKKGLGGNLRVYCENVTAGNYCNLPNIYNDLISHTEAITSSSTDAAQEIKVLMNSPINNISNFIERILNLCFKSNALLNNNSEKLISSYLLANQLLKQKISETSPSLMARIATQISLYGASIAGLPIDVSARKNFSMLATLARENKQYLEKKPLRQVREIKEINDNEDEDFDGEVEEAAQAGVAKKKPWQKLKMKLYRQPGPLARDREQPLEGSMHQEFPSPRSTVVPKRNGWNDRNNIPHNRPGLSRTLSCFKCGQINHLAASCNNFAGPVSRYPCRACKSSKGLELYHMNCNPGQQQKVEFISLAKNVKSKNGRGRC